MLIHNATTNTQHFIDFRETAPSGASPDMYYGQPEKSRVGGLAIGIPGEIKGFYEAWSVHGSLPWITLFQPAILMAKSMKCSKLLNMRLTSLGSATPEIFKRYYWINGAPCREGDFISRPELANTLELISKFGPSVLYDGALSAKIVEEIATAGGIITEQDLRDYLPVRRTPVHTYFHGLKVVTAPPPSSGNIFLMGLNIIEGFELSSLGQSNVLSYHYQIEAMKHGFGHRSLLGDPNFVNDTSIMSKLHQKDFAQSILSKISPLTTYPSEFYLYNGKTSQLGGGTTHLSVIDENHNTVSLTCSVNHLFGSLVMSPSTGIIFNNHMDDFSTQPNQPNQFGLMPSQANIIEPGKRPLSSMSPTIAFQKNSVKFALGASGGAHIISSVFQVLSGLVNFNSDLRAQIELGRWHTQLYPQNVRLEKEVPGSIVNGLAGLGHNVSVSDAAIADGQTSIGVVQAIMVEDNDIYAVSDPRKFGTPSGY
jgi:gamma-glutamyltranspeptidase/glutathione hydrolase/leukotriene-C4 hydrolase